MKNKYNIDFAFTSKTRTSNLKVTLTEIEDKRDEEQTND